MKALHAQMNPHFIFNSLNSIKEMILHQDTRNASLYLSRFAHLIRLNLEHSRKTFITLRQNVEYLESYLEMEQLRFADFSYHIGIGHEVDPDEIRIAPMLIQPLVENAIKHGTQSAPPWHIEIQGFIENQQWQITVKDNGPGFSPESLANIDKKIQEIDERGLLPNLELNGMALLNIYIRLKLVYREKMLFQIETPGESGAMVTIGGILENKEVQNGE